MREKVRSALELNSQASRAAAHLLELAGGLALELLELLVVQEQNLLLFQRPGLSSGSRSSRSNVPMGNSGLTSLKARRTD